LQTPESYSLLQSHNRKHEVHAQLTVPFQVCKDMESTVMMSPPRCSEETQQHCNVHRDTDPTKFTSPMQYADSTLEQITHLAIQLWVVSISLHNHLSLWSTHLCSNIHQSSQVHVRFLDFGFHIRIRFALRIRSSR
jgi:hypothetical protein